LPFLIQPPSEFSDPTFKEHQGEEFLFVHAGQVEVDFMNERVLLEQGDALHFNAQTPHRLRSVGATAGAVAGRGSPRRRMKPQGQGMPHAFSAVKRHAIASSLPCNLHVDILTNAPIAH
jgi:mannose-6-phosphate isomerase-like protein (cupin superfamily)